MNLKIVLSFVQLLLIQHAGFISAIFSINNRFCQNEETSITFIKNLLENRFPFIDIPNWAEKSFISSDCSKRSLNFIPTQFIPKTTEYLDLSENNLKIITSADFLGLENIIVLNVELNCPKVLKLEPELSNFQCRGYLYVKPGTFKNLRNLRVLLLSKNFLREFPSELPASLLYVCIDYTLLGNITTSLLKNAPKLQGMSATSNCIVRGNEKYFCSRNFNISTNFSNFLDVLYLSQNAWTVIPSYFFYDNLRVLDLSLNPIERLRKNDFVNGTKLKVLMLNQMNAAGDGSYLFRIENGAFDYLVELEILYLALNEFDHIQNDLFRHNTQLRSLDLSGNNLFQTIYNPKYLSQLRLLKFLDISGNAVQVISNKTIHFNELHLGPFYANLTSLETLLIGYISSALKATYSAHSAQFDKISDESIDLLSSLKNLRVLTVSGLSLNSLNSSALHKLSSLKWFDASNNNIQFQFVKLQQPSSYKSDEPMNLDLKPTSRNISLHSIKPIENNYNIIAGLSNYRGLNNDCVSNIILNLSNNLISNLTNRLNFLSQACVIDLSFNRIHRIRSNDFENFSRLKILILDNNPLHMIDPNALTYTANLKILRLDNILLQPTYYLSLLFLYKLPNSTHVNVKWKDKSDVVSALFYIWYVKTINAFFYSVSSLDLSNNLLVYDVRIFTYAFQLVVHINVRGCQIFDTMLISPLLASGNILKSLDLGENQLLQLPLQATSNLQNLEILMLDHNSIFALSGTFLCNLTSLQTFKISYNKITYIQPSFFSHSKLSYLDLSYNEIARLGDEILSLEVLSVLNYLDIRGNLIDCSCGVWDTLHLWTISPESQHVIIPGFVPKCSVNLNLLYEGCVACQSPYNLRGTSLLSYIAHPSCEVALLVTFSAFFVAFILIFILFGTLGYSKWMKRLVFHKVNQYFRVSSLHHETELLNETSVFVVFDLSNNEIGDWVDHRLCKAMSNGYPPISLKIHGKDNSCGSAPSQQLLRNIINCRKTILLLSYDFCLEKTCSFIISALQELRYSKGDDHLMLVAWTGENGAPRVPREIQKTLNRKKQYFLKFDYTNDDEEMFFETLRTALHA